MTLNDIYNEFNAGSQGFATAVQSYCGFDCSDSEIERLAAMSANADEFQKNWENDDSWTDANNAA